ncbi:hypothetical protein SCREM2_gp105 [Synechococcus phage S-CREM2]|nr:hypothetical protein SCREM2_gp105 [Synechococcus phage S-CREM2]
MNQCNKCPQGLAFGGHMGHTIGVKTREHPVIATALTTKEKADLAGMACKRLYLDTLEEQKSDSLDFHELAVWQIEDLIQRAYVMGLQAAGQ